MDLRAYPLNPILVIACEDAHLLSTGAQLQLAGFNNVLSCSDNRQAMTLVEINTPSVVLLDLGMPQMKSETVLGQMSSQYPSMPIIVIAEPGDSETAMNCLQSGAFDYILRPVDENRLVASIKKALQYSELHLENRTLKKQLRMGSLKRPEVFAGILTNSPKMLLLFSYIESIATSLQPVLLLGETGTGKKMVARALHALSGKTGKFIAIKGNALKDDASCKALFGQGQETGSQGPNLVELSANGTLYLDTISDLSQSPASMLLHLLAGKGPMPYDRKTCQLSRARIIASSRLDLWELHNKAPFARDMHCRPRIHTLILPPLRERKEDIGLRAEYFSHSISAALKKHKPKIPQELFSLLETYHFPGNIRELQTMVFDAITQNQNEVLPLTAFRSHISRAREVKGKLQQNDLKDGLVLNSVAPLPTIEQATRMLIEQALRQAGNDRSVAATMLGITLQTLSKRMKDWEKES